MIPSALISINNNRSVISCINPTFYDIEIEIPQICATQVYVKEIQFKNNNKFEKRSKLIENLIRTDHMNTIEKENIINNCKEFNDVFQLEGYFFF